MMYDEYTVTTPGYTAQVHVPRVAPDEGSCRLLTDTVAYFIDRGTALAYIDYCKRQPEFTVTERVRP